MANERVADMTIQELKALINSIIDERLRAWPGQRTDRPIGEVLESMRKNLIQPEPGMPSSLDLLREERDNRAKSERSTRSPNEQG